MAERLSDSEILRFVVRSHARLREIAGDKIDPKDYQTKAWFAWDEQLFAEAVARGLFPSVPEWVLGEVRKGVSDAVL